MNWWILLVMVPPWPNQVMTKKSARASKMTAKIWRQKPPGSSCSTGASFLVRFAVLRVDFRFLVGMVLL